MVLFLLVNHKRTKYKSYAYGHFFYNDIFCYSLHIATNMYTKENISKQHAVYISYKS